MLESAVQSSRWIHQLRPSRVWLVGIAGTYSDQLQVGQAYEFTHCACYGIGVGSGAAFLTIEELGWPRTLQIDQSDQIDLRDLNKNSDPAYIQSPDSNRLLISSTAASASLAEAQQKLAKFPNALAEDMEAFAVASACKTGKVALRIIRGISNHAGDRDHQKWKTSQAMLSAVKLLSQLMESNSD